MAAGTDTYTGPDVDSRSELEDKLKGLGLGADDYLTKPFDMEELVARIRVITRRQGAVQIDYLELEDLRLNLDSGVIVNTETQQEVRLGKKEFQLLELFMRNSGQTLRREQIAEKLWGYDCEAEYNNVEVYISFTRRKLKYIESRVLIKAVRGIGYRLEKRMIKQLRKRICILLSAVLIIILAIIELYLYWENCMYQRESEEIFLSQIADQVLNGTMIRAGKRYYSKVCRYLYFEVMTAGDWCSLPEKITHSRL